MRVAAVEPLIERETELEVIRAAVRNASAGAGRSLVIEGPAGIGKTRLLLAARESANEAAMRVLHARGSELEREFPYGLVRQLFEPALADAQDDERRALTSGAARIVEPLLAQGGSFPPPALGDSSWIRSTRRNGSGHPQDASAVLGRAIEAASEVGNVDLALQLEVQRLTIDLVPPNEIKARMEPYRERSQAGTSADRLWLAVEAWRLMLTGEGAREAAGLARRALDGWRIFVEQPASMVPSQLVLVLAVAEDFELAERALEVMIAGARAIGSAPLEGASLGLRSELEFRRGMIAGASADARTAIEIARSHAFVPALPLVIAWITQTLVERGELVEAARELEISGMEVEVPDHMSFTPILYCRAMVALGEGKHRRALEDLMEIGRREARSETSFFSWDSDAAIVHASLGERDEAVRLAKRGLERAGRWGTAGSLGHATRSLGLVVGGHDGIEHLRAAVKLLEESQSGLEHMRALTDFGAALRRAGRRVDAREPLREAHELARRRGALAIAKRTHEELAATGEKLGPLIAVGVESLTPSERRIAGMAAEGLTNREIAQTLFLSVKTVESHLRGAYRKLEVRSREELPHALEGG